MRRFARSEAQAIVEFALAATLVFFLLAAAVDLGFLFFTKQGITNAAQEGATYGSRWLEGEGQRYLNIPEIQNRVRFESGANGGNGIVRLTDLNSDGVDDSAQGGVIDASGVNGFIKVRALADANSDGNPVNDGGALCVDPATSIVSCYVHVTVQKVYRFFFGFAPVFGSEVTISSSYYVLIRDSYRSGSSARPVFLPPPPPPDENNLVVEWVEPSNKFPSNTNGTAFEAKAYDKSVGTTNGAGIAGVVLEVHGPGGQIARADDNSARYCVFNNCGKMSSTQWGGLKQGKYIFVATATGKNGKTKSATLTLIK